MPYTAKNVTDAFGRLAEMAHICRDVLRADLELEPDEDVHVFTATADRVRVGAAALLGMLEADAQRSRDDITAAERDLFDRPGRHRRGAADRPAWV